MSFLGLRKRFCVLAIVVFGVYGASAQGQTSSPSADKKDAQPAAAQQDQQVDPLKRQVDEKTRKKQAEALKKEVSRVYKDWLDVDVRWIITDEERAAFKQLSNDEEREQFTEQFWMRRDPTPDTFENETKEEHYRRIAYANERFASGVPGWKTDRGRIYIMYGKPDETDSHPSGGTYYRTAEEGGGSTQTYPFEIWRYRYIDGRDLGQEVMIEFVDTCGCNEYRMTYDRSEKDALLHVPGAGLTDYEAMGMASKADRWNGGLEKLGAGAFTSRNQSQQFDRLAQYAALNRAPEVKFKDLEEQVTHKIRVNMLPFDVRVDFVKITDIVLVPVTIQVKNKDLTWNNKEGVQRMVVNVFGRVTTLTGRITQTFEETLSNMVPEDLLPKAMENSHVYWKALPLRPGRYRLDLVLKDVNGDRVGTWSKGIVVPEYSEDKLAASTLILADQMNKVPAKEVGTGNFVIGSTKVRPRVEPSDGRTPATFERNQRVNFWMQVYNLGIDEKSKKPNATIEYDIVNAASNKSVVHMVESTEQLGNVGDQLTLEKSMPLNGLEPGVYRVTIKVDDKVGNQTISPTARFAVQ